MEIHNMALKCHSFLVKYYAQKSKKIEAARLECVIMSLLQSKNVKVFLSVEEPREVFALPKDAVGNK